MYQLQHLILTTMKTKPYETEIIIISILILQERSKAIYLPQSIQIVIHGTRQSDFRAHIVNHYTVLPFFIATVIDMHCLGIIQMKDSQDFCY